MSLRGQKIKDNNRGAETNVTYLSISFLRQGTEKTVVLWMGQATWIHPFAKL